MRAIDADALQLAIVEEGQANKRKKYSIGDIWELTGAEIREVINSMPTIQPEQLGTNLAEVGTDLISRQQAIDLWGKYHYTIAVDAMRYDAELRQLLSAQLTPDQNGDLWITVPDIDKVTRIYVQESKSKFCRIFYEEQPERIIHCKDCEWWTKQECSPQGRCALSRMYPTGGWFCGNARRREVTE